MATATKRYPDEIETTLAISPCPFCVARDYERPVLRRIVQHFVECQNDDCYARGPLVYSEAAAVEAWNKRTAAPAAKGTA